MDCLSPSSPVERVVFMKGAQIGGSETGNNWIGYVIHHAPGPMMAVAPTVEMAKRNSKQRIDPLIEESAILRELIAPARSRDSGNTILAKEFRGGTLVLTGANSAVGLRSMPVRYLFLDEVDGYPVDVEGEGSAIALAEARTRTFARRKIFIVSTPTIAGASAIEREYEASDQRRYFVPCPHCGHRQWLRFEQLRWEKGSPATAAYVCEACAAPIAEHHKTGMLEQGEWRALAPENGSRTAGFHLSSLYSPVGWRSWRDIAAAWESAVSQQSGSAAAIKTFKNTELGRDLGRGRRGAGLAAPARTAGGLSDRHRARRRSAAGRRGRRAEGPHRSLDLGLRPRQGVLAGRAPGADGRHRPRRGVETPGRAARRDLDPRLRGAVAARPFRARHRLRHPGGLRLRARVPRSPASWRSKAWPGARR